MTIRELVEKVESEVELVGYSSEEDSYTTIPNDEVEAYYDYSVVSIYVPNTSNVIVVEFYLLDQGGRETSLSDRKIIAHESNFCQVFFQKNFPKIA